MIRALGALTLLAALAACAPATRSSQIDSTDQLGRNNPDCSFRSPTTCWTIPGRFPAPEPVATPPIERAPEAAPVLARGADSVPSH